MLVKDLIDKLNKLDPNKEVFIPHNEIQYEYYIVNSVKERTLSVLDEDLNCVIIDFE